MSRIISAGHICIDITPVFPPHRSYSNPGELLEPGKLIHMEGADVHTGGSVGNTGLALKLLGNDVRLPGKIGGDAFGGMIQSIFASFGAEGLIVDEKGKTSYTVVLALPGIDRMFLHDPGANDTFVSDDIPERDLSRAQLLHFGYPPLMKSMIEKDGEELVKLFRRAKEQGVATSLDFAAIDPDSFAGHADWMLILRKVLPYVDFFVPSFEEMCYILDPAKFERLMKRGRDMTEGLDLEREVLPFAEQLLSMGCRAVLMKCGTSGMIYKTAGRAELERNHLPLNVEAWADRTGIQPCFKADIVRSATGAGDTSVAAFLTAVLMGRAPADCAALAAAEGACCVTTYDSLSGLLPLPELEKRIRSGWSTIRVAEVTEDGSD